MENQNVLGQTVVGPYETPNQCHRYCLAVELKNGESRQSFDQDHGPLSAVLRLTECDFQRLL